MKIERLSNLLLLLVFISVVGYCEEPEKTPQNGERTPKVVDITTAMFTSFCMLDDGSLINWGSNERGTLGRGSMDANLPPGRAHIENVTAVALCDSTTLFLQNDGTVWTCGRQNLGGNTNDKSGDLCEPAKVQGIDKVTAIAAGSEYLLALREDGTVWVWGKGNTGRRETDDPVINRVPVQVQGLQSITAIGAFMNHNLALDKDGQLWAWGNNQLNVLGLNIEGTKRPISDQLEPAKVPFCDKVSAFSTSESMTLILGKNRKAAALGGGNTVRYRIPINESNRPDFNTYFVIDDFDDVASVTTAFGSVILTLADGKIMCWGDDQFGNLAMPEQEFVEKPTEMSLPMKYDKIVFGYMHTLALKDGKVYAWGCNQQGQLGCDADRLRYPIPLEVDLSKAIAEIVKYRSKK